MCQVRLRFQKIPNIGPVEIGGLYSYIYICIYTYHRCTQYSTMIDWGIIFIYLIYIHLVFQGWGCKAFHASTGLASTSRTEVSELALGEGGVLRSYQNRSIGGKLR